MLIHIIMQLEGRNYTMLSSFRQNGLKLHFLEMNAKKYKQFDNEFIPNLSIIDVLMFNSIGSIRQLLNQYTLHLGGGGKEHFIIDIIEQCTGCVSWRCAA